MSKRCTPIAAAIVLAGCGNNLADEAENAQGSVLLACQGTRVTKDFIPNRFTLRSSTHSETNWYRDYFKSNLGADDFLEYTSIPGYFESSPEKLADRPVSGNTLPYDTYAISYFYADSEYRLHPMNMYFGNFPEPFTHNKSGGVLHFPYRVYLTAPEDARYVVMKLHDSAWGWEYQTEDGEWLQGMDEVWYARPADDLVRTEGTVSVQDQPYNSWKIPEFGNCRLEYAWRDERDDLYGGSDDEVMLREDIREIEQRIDARNERSGAEAPSRTVLPNSPGMTQAQNPKGKHFGFPLIGFTKEEAVEALSSGDIDSGWSEGKWHAPAL